MECARKDVFKEYNIDGSVTCENRSLDELRDKTSPSSEFVEERVEALPCNSNSLRFFHDCTIALIADLLEGDELSIVPDGPSSLAPYVAFLDDKFKKLNKSGSIVPSLTSLKLIWTSAQNYHKGSRLLLVGDPCVEEIAKQNEESVLLPLQYARKEVNIIGEMLGVEILT